MKRLAYQGGKPIIKTPIQPLRSVAAQSYNAITEFMTHAANGFVPLSGYLAGSQHGGGAVQRLEQTWSQTFRVNHSIACNSCTSAILAAIAALDPKVVHIPVMGMSAIAACPKILGKEIRFWDVDKHYCIQTPRDIQSGDVILAVNLFGHPAKLREIAEYADSRGAYLIEDNAQGLFATENNVYAGTIGHIGCWSGNVHKPLNCGELGVLTTNDDYLERALRAFINHGEMSGHNPGLNLRCHELVAILALSQLETAKSIIYRREEIWAALLDIDYDDVFQLPGEREGCESSWYCIPILAPTRDIRDFAVKALNAEGLPCRAGYVMLPTVKAFAEDPVYHGCPDADVYNDCMILIEITSIDPTDEQVVQMSEALLAIGEDIYDPKNRSRAKW